MSELDRASPISPASPGLPRVRRSAIALVLLWAYGFFVAILAAVPVLGVARVLYGGNPSGDAPLAEPGGLALADLLLGRGAAPFAAALPSSATILVVGALLGHLPFGALVAHLQRQGRGTLGEAYERAFASFFPLVGLTALSLAAQAIVLALGAVASEALGSVLTGKLDERSADLTALAVLLPFGAAVLVVHTVTDLAYASLFVRGSSLPGAILTAGGTFRRNVGATLRPALLAYAGGLAAFAGASVGTGLLGPSTWPTRMLLVHQAALLAKTTFRAMWLARAIQLTRGATEADEPATEASETGDSPGRIEPLEGSAQAAVEAERDTAR